MPTEVNTPSSSSGDHGDQRLLIERKKQIALIKRETKQHIHRNVSPDAISRQLISCMRGIDALLEDCPKHQTKNLFILTTVKDNLRELYPKVPEEIKKTHKELNYIYEYASLEDI